MPGQSLRSGVVWRRKVREDERRRVEEDEGDEEEEERESGLRFVVVADAWLAWRKAGAVVQVLFNSSDDVDGELWRRRIWPRGIATLNAPAPSALYAPPVRQTLICSCFPEQPSIPMNTRRGVARAPPKGYGITGHRLCASPADLKRGQCLGRKG